MTRPIFHPVEQGSEAWHDLRRTGIGGSDIGVLTGDAPWGDVQTLYQEKLNLTARSVTSGAMELGHWLEDAIRAWYAKEKGLPTRRVRGIYRHPEHRFVIASLDGMTLRRPRRVVQVKVKDSQTDEWGEPGTDEIPDHVREQVEWEMIASGLEVADVVVYFVRARRAAIYTVERDPELDRVLIDVYAAPFWRAVEERSGPPEPVGRLAAGLVRLKADEIEADDELAALVALHAQAKTAYDQAERELDVVKDALRARLADVGGVKGQLSDGRPFSVSYRPSSGGTEIAWELVVNELKARLVEAAPGEVREQVAEELEQLITDYESPKKPRRDLRVSVRQQKRSAR